LKNRIVKRGHAVILVAEGAGQELLPARNEKDASGNNLHVDIGVFLKDQIVSYFKKEGIPCNLKYIAINILWCYNVEAASHFRNGGICNE